MLQKANCQLNEGNDEKWNKIIHSCFHKIKLNHLCKFKWCNTGDGAGTTVISLVETVVLRNIINIY